jgi:type IV pilus assembly protein PilW
MNAPRPQAHLPPAPRHQHRIRQRGFSMVELLVALTIGLFLSAGVLQLFLGTRQTYRFEESLARLQENGRYAIEAISRDLRMVGHIGCGRLGDVVLTNLVDRVEFSDETLISDAIEDTVADDVASGTDFMRLRLLSAESAWVTEDMERKTDPIVIASNPGGFDDDDILAISNCENIDIFAPSSVTSTEITPANALSEAYNVRNITEGDEDEKAGRAALLVKRLRDVTYYVHDNGLWRSRYTPDEDNDTARNIKEELLDGVQDMWIQYGTPDGYEDDPDDVADWREVRGVRISLLLVSPDIGSNDAPQSLEWRGVTQAYEDGRLRQVFSATIALRNRLQ